MTEYLCVCVVSEDGSLSEEKAAEKIQASFRGYKTRKSLKNNGILPPVAKDDTKANGGIESKVKDDQQSEEIASKPKSAAASELDEILDIDLTDKDLEKAAAKIQASYRNFTKKKIATAAAPEPQEAQKPDEKQTEKADGKDAVDEENLEDIDLGDPEVEKAALKIQSTFRGYKIRKEINIDEKPLENGEKAEDEE